MKTPFYKKKWFIVVAVICVLAIIGNAVSGNESEETTKEEKKVETAAPVETKDDVEEDVEVKEETPKTPEERISTYINSELGERTNNDKDRIASVGYVADTLEIILNADDNLTTNLTKLSMLKNANDVFEELKGYEDVEGDVIVGFMIDLVDQYGNAEAGKVLSIRLTQETLEKINFENFDYNNYEAIADVYFVHPALQ